MKHQSPGSLWPLRRTKAPLPTDAPGPEQETAFKQDETFARRFELGVTAPVATFASKGHDVFAAVHGRLSLDEDRATIDRLWNRFVAAWYEGGKDDPKKDYQDKVGTVVLE